MSTSYYLCCDRHREVVKATYHRAIPNTHAPSDLLGQFIYRHVGCNLISVSEYDGRPWTYDWYNRRETTDNGEVPFAQEDVPEGADRINLDESCCTNRPPREEGDNPWASVAEGLLVFSGIQEGAALREKLDLDQKDYEEDPVYVFVSENTISVNSSFFRGLFWPSLEVLGVQTFQAKYRFRGKDITLVVEDAIKEYARRHPSQG